MCARAHECVYIYVCVCMRACTCVCCVCGCSAAVGTCFCATRSARVPGARAMSAMHGRWRGRQPGRCTHLPVHVWCAAWAVRCDPCRTSRAWGPERAAARSDATIPIPIPNILVTQVKPTRPRTCRGSRRTARSPAPRSSDGCGSGEPARRGARGARVSIAWQVSLAVALPYTHSRAAAYALVASASPSARRVARHCGPKPHTDIQITHQGFHPWCLDAIISLQKCLHAH